MLQASKAERTDMNWNKIKSCSDRNHIFGLFNMKVEYFWSFSWCSQSQYLLKLNTVRSNAPYFRFKDCGGWNIDWLHQGCKGHGFYPSHCIYIKSYIRPLTVKLRKKVGFETKNSISLWQEKGERGETMICRSKMVGTFHPDRRNK